MNGHTNAVIEAATLRARDEQQMQNLLQSAQYQAGVYNPDLEPEHESDWCSCHTCIYRRAKWSRTGVQRRWWDATSYPGEHHYNHLSLVRNPYKLVISPYGYFGAKGWGYIPRPSASAYTKNILQTIDINKKLNEQAQKAIDAKEPIQDIWALRGGNMDDLKSVLPSGDEKPNVPCQNGGHDMKGNGHLDSSLETDFPAEEKGSASTSVQYQPPPSLPPAPPRKKKGFFAKLTGSTSTPSLSAGSSFKSDKKASGLADQILAEENGRWPDEYTRTIVAQYQEKIGMKIFIERMRQKQPIQYLHLLRAGYLEPIPVAWADSVSNPLKFSIEAASGWRGITPAWRGYEDTAEERAYWTMNHRIGASSTMRLKPDPISEMSMARARMATAEEPPPQYFAADDQCHVQHTSEGYSKQVLPPPFQPYDRPELPSDDTMILLDVSGSMDFDPLRPIYDEYLVTGWAPSTQPKNKDVAKAIIRRFTSAMENYDHNATGYDMFTFSTHSKYIGCINHRNFDTVWKNVHLGGGTRVMTGWQKVKEAHFEKHQHSATIHPVFGWQAGPETPMLRLLLLLDGEATDMDEFELDLLGLSWAHVTIFLIGVDGCPHHARHANELQRISDTNHHVSFVDAQGNCPERFVTHELLKRHLGVDLSLQKFEQLEIPPAYSLST